jgi:hypothetical protein
LPFVSRTTDNASRSYIQLKGLLNSEEMLGTKVQPVFLAVVAEHQGINGRHSVAIEVANDYQV